MIYRVYEGRIGRMRRIRDLWLVFWEKEYAPWLLAVLLVVGAYVVAVRYIYVIVGGM